MTRTFDVDALQGDGMLQTRDGGYLQQIRLPVEPHPFDLQRKITSMKTSSDIRTLREVSINVDEIALPYVPENGDVTRILIPLWLLSNGNRVPLHGQC